MNQYIYKIQPVRIGMLQDGATGEEERIVGEHFAYLKSLAAAGRLYTAGRTLIQDERTFGIVIFAASTDQEAESILAQDPAVAQGVFRGEVYPFRVALWAGDPMASRNS